MRLVAEGVVFDAANAPMHQRSCAFTAATLLRDGTLLVTGRRGSDRESLDGHVCVFASNDGGDSWEERYDGLGRGAWDGVPGEEKALLIAEMSPGVLTGTVLWVDRSGPPRPFVNPRTQGLLPTRIGHLTSHDGGRRWGDGRLVPVTPHPGASPTGPLLRLADGTLAQPYEHWKEFDDPAPGRPAALLRLSTDGGMTWPAFVTVATDPAGRLYYWDQRLAIHPTAGQLVAMFWTHDAATGQDRDVHLAHGTAAGRQWSVPIATGLPGQHCQPIPVGGDRLVAVYVHRHHQPGIRAVLSPDFGRTWERAGEATIYASPLGAEAGAAGARSIGDFWDDMITWRFGHPRGLQLPSGEVFIVYYAGDDRAKSIRWARLAV